MISIIIIVKNDRGVEMTLEHLHKLHTKYKTEIILVDASEGKLDDIKVKFPLVNWINFKNTKNKRITIPEQRNIGLKNAKGDIIVFTDASCVPEKNWLEELLKPINIENEKIVMGRTGSVNKYTLNDIYHDKLKESKYVSEAPTINLAIAKEVLLNIGIFDEDLEYGSDVDLTWRATENGYSIRYQPKAIVNHDWGTPTDEFKRTYYYGKARTRILLKHLSSKWKNLFTVDSPVLLYPTLILSLFAILVFPFYFFIFAIVNTLLLIKNAKEPYPMIIIGKHYIYGLGVLAEIYDQIKSFVLMKIWFRLEYYFTIVITLNKKLDGKVKNRDFTILSNNCWGAEIYRELHILYQTPLVGLYIYPDDYVKLLENISKYMSYDLSFITRSRYLSHIKSDYPIGLLNDIELHFIHYQNEAEAKEKWQRRRGRINYKNIFIELSDRDNLSIKTYERFNNLPYRKVCFVASEEYHGKNTLVVKEAKKYGKMFDGKILYNYSKKYFDIAKWLNEK